MPDSDTPLPSKTVAPTGLLLAAGLSRRMGADNKLLVEIDGMPMVRRAAGLLLACRLDVWVVTGHEGAAVEAALEGLDVKTVRNPGFEHGQRSSVIAGLKAIAAARPGPVLVALADQPWLVPDDIGQFVTAFASTPGDAFLVPWYDGRRGNPVIVPAGIVAEIAAGADLPQSGPLTDCFPGRVRRWEAPNDHFVRDIDTAEALAHFRQQ